MKRFFLLILGLSSIGFLHAQIGVNSNEPKVTLDVHAKATDGTTAEGLTAPRLTLAQLAAKDAKYIIDQRGTIVYVTNVTGTTTAKTKNVISVGYYYFDGALWQSMGPDPATRFFYMPAVVLPTNTADPAYNAGTQIFTIDLYSAYSKQFKLTTPSTSAKSPGATAIPVSASNSLEYFITYFDNTVFQNVQLTDAGKLTYKLVAGFAVSEKTFMNIVFKVK